MKKHLFTALFSAFLLSALPAFAAVDADGAENFVKKITREGIEEIVDSDISQKEKDEHFEKLFNEALDLKFIGQFVLGRYWRAASQTQKNEFIEVYRQLNIKTWSKRFDEFKGKNFIFDGTSPSTSANQIFVNSKVPMEQGNPITVVWRVKQTGDTFKIVDIIIENVSLAMTARNEYTTFISKSPDGLNGLISDLKKKLEQQ